jgi:hypothetical protein
MCYQNPLDFAFNDPMFIHLNALNAPSPSALSGGAPAKATTVIESVGLYLPPKGRFL